MPGELYRLYSLFIGIALGHIQTAYILGRVVRKIDIRDYGSGNSGMTNAARVMGGKIGAVVLLTDVIKSFAAFIICAAIFKGSCSFYDFGGAGNILPGLYGALGAVLGHMFPVYMRFRGGKSIAAGIGLILALDIRVAGIILLFAMLIILLTRYVSAASIISVVLLPILVNVFGYSFEAVIICVFIGVLIIYKHKDNIRRIVNGAENKVGKKR